MSTGSATRTCNSGTPNVFSGTEITCVDCGAGMYKTRTDTATSCTGCPDNSDSPEASDELNDCVAVAGYTGQGSGVTACPVDTFKADVSSAGCSNCSLDTGTGGLHGATAENECLALTCTPASSPLNGSVSCTNSSANISACKFECHAGYFLSGPATVSCNLTESTSFVGVGGENASAVSCTTCAVDTFSGGGGELESACSPCPFNSSTKATVTAAASAADCECDPGFHGPDGGPCEACVKGHYKLSAGPSPCEACLHNTFQDRDASKLPCNECPPHSATSLNGSSKASDCACAHRWV